VLTKLASNSISLKFSKRNWTSTFGHQTKKSDVPFKTVFSGYIHHRCLVEKHKNSEATCQFATTACELSYVQWSEKLGSAVQIKLQEKVHTSKTTFPSHAYFNFQTRSPSWFWKKTQHNAKMRLEGTTNCSQSSPYLSTRNFVLAVVLTEYSAQSKKCRLGGTIYCMPTVVLVDAKFFTVRL